MVFLESIRRDCLVIEQPEIALTGGRTSKDVVRIGQTVRKIPTPNSKFVHEVLLFLESQDFEGTPKSLGTDEKNRDVFEYIEGYVPNNLSIYNDETLALAAKFIRQFHDATVKFVAYRYNSTPPNVICHNDLSPCNFVFRNDRPIALIDFDASALGSRAHDLGYAVWLWLDLGTSVFDATNQKRRLDLFHSAYGKDAVDIHSLLSAILTRQSMLIEEGTRNEVMKNWAKDCRNWVEVNFYALGCE